MRIIKSFFIAFSMYSKIPMPQFEWKDEDMRYALCFFPWVGAVIGVLWYLWKWICARFGVGTLCYTVVGTAIPILITGGFHVDGFLDTCDALHSYQPRERKLEILKDSHIGAFAVIMLTLYGLIFLGGFSEITECRTLVVAGAGSFLSRVLSGVAVVSFPSAKQEGTLYLFADKAHKRVVKTALYAQGILCIGFMMWTSFVTGGNYPTADLLFSGPMKRCLETAQILYPGQTPIFVPEWTEMDFGAFEGHNYQELSGDPAYQRWIDSGGTLPFPEGESREEFIRRNVAGYEKMLYYMKMILERSAASEQGDYNTGSEKTELERSDEIGAQDAGIQSVSAVVHGGTIMALLSHFLGEQYFNYQVKCGQGYSGRLVFLAGGGTPEWKEFRPLSEFTKGETY